MDREHRLAWHACTGRPHLVGGAPKPCEVSGCLQGGGQGGRVWDAWATSQQRKGHLPSCSTSSRSAEWTVPPALPTTASCARPPAAASAQGRGAQTPRAPPHQRAWASQAGQTPPACRARAIDEAACGWLQCWFAECSSAGKPPPPPNCGSAEQQTPQLPGFWRARWAAPSRNQCAPCCPWAG